MLDSLKRYTVVVADTGDIDAMREYQPRDATTNPSLLLKAAPQAQYRSLVDAAIRDARALGLSADATTAACMDRLAVNFGCEILILRFGHVGRIGQDEVERAFGVADVRAFDEGDAIGDSVAFGVGASHFERRL